MPSNGAENDRCTSMWSLPHITSKEFIVGIPSGRSSGHISLPANTKLIWKWWRICENLVKIFLVLPNGHTHASYLLIGLVSHCVLVPLNDNNLHNYSHCRHI